MYFGWPVHSNGGARNVRYLQEEVVAIYGLDPRLPIETEEGPVVWKRQMRGRHKGAEQDASVALGRGLLGACSHRANRGVWLGDACLLVGVSLAVSAGFTPDVALVRRCGRLATSAELVLDHRVSDQFVRHEVFIRATVVGVVSFAAGVVRERVSVFPPVLTVNGKERCTWASRYLWGSAVGRRRSGVWGVIGLVRSVRRRPSRGPGPVAAILGRWTRIDCAA